MSTSGSHIILKNAQTGVYIREFMEETLQREIARCERHERSLCIAFAQIEKFQIMENRFGPKVSEQILIHVASRMQLALRQCDSLIGNWGPGQFLIGLLECNLQGALSALERVRNRVTAEP